MRAHSFDGRHKPRERKRTGISQASDRRGIIAYDQHGRPYSGVIELRSHAPTGPMHPMFSAPWHMDGQYIIVNEENPTELFLDYKACFQERRALEQEYYQRAVRVSVKEGWEAPQRGKYSDKVIEKIGTPPKSFLPVAAAYQENPWMIGACRGCSARDRSGEWIPRFSFNCECRDGFKPFKPDPRLAELVIPPDQTQVDDESLDDFSIDKYAELTGQSIDEVRQRPSQFRRVRKIVDGPAQLGDETAATTAALEQHAVGAEMSEDDEEKLNAAINELESAPDDDHMMFSHGSVGDELEDAVDVADLAELDADEVQEQVDPAAVGGRTVPVTPAARERVERQAPRAGNGRTPRQVGAQRSAQAAAKKRAEQERAANATRRPPAAKRPSLADGAKPVISD
jgi:hypothetical protein